MDASRRIPITKPAARASGQAQTQALWAWIQRLALAFFLILLVRLFVLDTLYVNGASMTPNLADGQNMLLNKTAYWFASPQRGDVVVCRYPGLDDNFVKRIIGLPGERVSIVNHTLQINGVAVQELYILEPMEANMPETVVPPGQYFVMGDNRNDSKDSRDKRVGAIEKNAILAKVMAVVWPLPDMQPVKRELTDVLPSQ